MTYSIDYETRLNPAQYEAVMFNKGPLLVIAGAGTGKTRTLTFRVARLVESGFEPSSILLLTFTRKAAAEMLKRAEDLLDTRCRHVAGGTFHSFAYAMLRRFGSAVGVQPGAAILDRADSENLIGIIKDEEIRKDRSFPKKKTLAAIFSRAVNKTLSVEDVISRDYPHFQIHIETIIRLMRLYQQKKLEHQFLDYDDLLVYFSRLLEEHPDVRRIIAERYSHTMVDEYQDTNRLQAKIVTLIANEERNVMAVGDDAQSIYAFRGAQVENIMRFPELFPGTRIIRLEENFRSTQPILDLTNHVISRAKKRYEKTLYTRKTRGNMPVIVRAADENAQSKFVVERIISLQRQGMGLSETAVLFRSGYHSFDLEIELNRHRIPYVKVGGFKFTESAHIKDFIAHLKVMVHPVDRISWYRVLMLIEKVGPKTAREIFSSIQESRSGCTAISDISAKPSFAQGIARLGELFSAAATYDFDVQKVKEAAFSYYKPIMQKKFDDHPKRTRDLEQLLTIMENYDNLEQFLSDMALEPPSTESNGNLETGATSGKLVLSTIHSAKGLEWEAVFIISAVEGRFPSVHSTLREEDIEEERRLMYVAATRAKSLLYILYPSNIYDRASGTILYRPSSFIEDIPADMVEKKYIGF